MVINPQRWWCSSLQPPHFYTPTSLHPLPFHSTDPPTNLSDPRLVQATDALAEAVDPDIKRKRVESEAAAWGAVPPAPTPVASTNPVSTSESTSTAAGGVAGGVAAENTAGGLAGLSVEELEKELARRKAASSPPADKA